NFTELAADVGYGDAPATAWRPITEVPLVILVGVTGVGKSTTLQALREQALAFRLLPDRRDLTDRLIIAFLQRQDGTPPHLVADRAERFRLTRRYREQFPGGMSHALSRLLVQRNDEEAQAVQPALWWFFDGLRGANEVEAAATLLPYARFVVLDAPDAVRVERLLGRADRFDHIALQAHTPATVVVEHTFATIGVPEADGLFNAEERIWLLSLCEAPVGSGTITVDDLRSRLKIVAEERRNYDPTAAMSRLQQHASERTLVIDTTQVAAEQAAWQIIQWLSKN
ncbi:MAG: AAA family ATPase, partial [Caldilineaceae bacterium]|nr:AAA family ATPase [Caldilineaceae bacterium]